MIIGVTGTNGSGKGEVANYLAEAKGFKHYSSREVITEEILRRGMPVNRDSMTVVANDMRRRDPAYPQTESLHRAEADHAENAVLESVREIAGAELIQAHGGFIIAVDADRKIRYERVMKRKSATDHVDFDTFVVQEDREMTSTDPTKQNVLGVMQKADITLINEGTLEEFQRKIDAALEELQKEKAGRKTATPKRS